MCGRVAFTHECARYASYSTSEIIARATLLYNISNALEHKGDYEAAKIRAQKSLDLRENILGEKHLETVHSLRRLGSVFRRKGKNVKAEKAFWQVPNSFEEMLGNDHSDTLVTVSHLRLVLLHQGKHEEAEILYQQAMSGFEKIVGKEHPDTLPSVSNLAGVLQEQGKYEETEGLHRRVLGAREKILGKEHPYTLMSGQQLGERACKNKENTKTPRN